MFKPTYLYIKTHTLTGLKYFGKTCRKDPYSYKGSGTRWNNHLKAHGNFVTTEIIGLFIDRDECFKAALDFSIKHDIKKSEAWANLKNETLDGGWGHITSEHIAKGVATFKKRPKAEQDKSNKAKARDGTKNFWYGKDRSGIKNPRFGVILSEDQKARQGEKMKGKKYGLTKDNTVIRVSTSDCRFDTGELVTLGKGTIVVKDKFGNTSRVQISDERVVSGELVHVNKGKRRTLEEKQRLSEIVSSFKWYNNGVVSIRRKDNPGEDWRVGRAIKIAE